uniref:Spindle and kinetochore associated complex subunit 3 n=1 Tax=Catharus ustulatus TaxID=91951 RepID=A0A8C3UIU1_CATUS
MHLEDYEDESPIAVLHDLHCKIKAHKEEVRASLDKSCSEEKAIREFMKASEILMQRNTADLGKISELFQKYGYKSRVKESTEEDEVNSESAMSVQNKSDEEKANDVPHLSASTEKPMLPKDPLRSPQLSDFGLSQLAVSRPWSVVKAQHTASARQQNSKNETPLRLQTPRALPKTPKCKLKMDDYECELEHFGISEHTMCMNEDYTMSLIHKTSQTIKNDCCLSGAGYLILLLQQQVTPGGKIESVTKNDAKDTPYKEKRIAFAASCDEYLKHPRDPSPPKLEDYDHLLNTPPPPEITRIPDDVLKMLSQYNRKVDASSKAKEMENKAGNTRRYESYSTDYCNKENRYDYILQV